MKIIYITMGRYGIMCTVNAESESDAESSLVETLETLNENSDVITVAGTDVTAPYAYAVKRLDSLSFLYTHEEIDLVHEPVKLSLPGIGSAIEIDCGVGVFLASTGWGKTTYMVKGLHPAITEQYGNNGVELINFGEPFENFGDIKTRIIFRAVDLLKEICEFANSNRMILMIDSFRPFLYDQSVGTTGERGIDAFLPVQLTALSNTLSVCGKLLFVTLNPMIDATTDREVERYERLQGSIEASVPFVLTGTSHRAATLSLRGVHNPNRDPRFINIPDLSSGITRSRSNHNNLESEVEMTVSLTPEEQRPRLAATDVRRFMNTISS